LKPRVPKRPAGVAIGTIEQHGDKRGGGKGDTRLNTKQRLPEEAIRENVDNFAHRFESKGKFGIVSRAVPESEKEKKGKKFDAARSPKKKGEGRARRKRRSRSESLLAREKGRQWSNPD